MEQRIGFAELTLARNTINQMLKNPEYDPETAGEILNGLNHPQLQDTLAGQNLQTTAITKTVVEYLAGNHLIPNEAAAKTLRFLDEARGLAETRTVTLRKVPIEQVGQFAKKELQGYIELEQAFQKNYEAKNGFNSLSILEKAIYNMELLNDWVSEGTWFNEYLTRKPTDIQICNVNPFGTSEIIESKSYYKYLIYTHKGIFLKLFFYGDSPKLTVPLLEMLWEKYREHKWVKLLASFNRLNFAEKLDKIIKS